MNRICKNCGKEFNVEYDNQVLCKEDLSKQGRRNKRKGAANESRFAKMLQGMFNNYDLNYKVQRTPRSGGIREFESADLMFSRVPSGSIFANIHFELKDTAHWYIEDWIKEAKGKELDSGKNRMPILIIRKPNQEQEFAVMDANKLMEILIAFEKLK